MNYKAIFGFRQQQKNQQKLQHFLLRRTWSDWHSCDTQHIVCARAHEYLNHFSVIIQIKFTSHFICQMGTRRSAKRGGKYEDDAQKKMRYSISRQDALYTSHSLVRMARCAAVQPEIVYAFKFTR